MQEELKALEEKITAPGFWDKPLSIALHLQAHYVVKRTYTKPDPMDPFFPGYSFGGYVLMGGVQISVPL